VRAEWLDRARSLCIDDFKETVLTGFERRFTLPASPNLPPPPRDKMVAITLLAIFPLSQACGALLGPQLVSLPAPVSAFAISVVLIALMTWVVMPRATRLFKRWSYPDA